MKLTLVMLMLVMGLAPAAQANLVLFCSDTNSPYFINFGSLGEQSVAFLHKNKSDGQTSQLVAAPACRQTDDMPLGNNIEFTPFICTGTAEPGPSNYEIDVVSAAWNGISAHVISEGKEIVRLDCRYQL